MLAASDRASHIEQEKLIVLDEEEQSRWENEIVSSSRRKLQIMAKTNLQNRTGSQESLQQLAGQTIFAKFEQKFPY